ncbi:IS1380 family transposase [Actinomyces lilanjuaniae]|uniref:IS1380 family transposase n=1 Tax=Actinomyces lilanjuaniae TaxID=2321394 RepID=A0ABM6Z688_9ACTO|nr:IS1380 family transposase [Actinomyces lilanjuaniae]AYD90758.1 IS1380 family transposase [Actinomyces lilanjuaniae]
MKTVAGLYPLTDVETGRVDALAHGGGALLTETVRACGLDVLLSQALASWSKPLARHDPAKVVLDLALSLAVGGDCLADVSLLRAEPQVFGPVASAPTLSRVLATLAADASALERAVALARARARRAAWTLAGSGAPTAATSAQRPLVIDIDATLVTAHSDKKGAAPTFKKGFGFRPLTARVDHGPQGAGESATIMLRPGSAGSNTAADHEAVTAAVPTQVGLGPRPGRKVVVRTDAAGGTKAALAALERRRVSCSVGFTLPSDMSRIYRLVPAQAWTPAYNADGDPREAADVAELTDLLDLDGRPKAVRVIVGRERPHPGAHPRLDDVDGYRLTAFATSTRIGQLADLEVRHRQRARCEDRVRCAKDTGLDRMPLQAFAANRIWCQVVALARDILAWTQMPRLADHPARRWEPKAVRHRLLNVPAVIARHARRTTTRYKTSSPFADLLTPAISNLRAHADP